MTVQRTSIFFLLVLAIAFVGCEPNNPFDRGPVYDVAGNLERDSLLIVDYLETAEIDSLYRIHDPSGVVIIVQEEGEGSRPTTGNIVYTNYIGSLMSDGAVFDTNIEQVAKDNDMFEENKVYLPFDFQLVGQGQQSGVIQGWQIGFRRLRSGSKAVVIIPSTWAYRNNPPNGSNIPDDAILLFDVEVKGID